MGMSFRYIMVTHWDDHWDRLRNNETHFSKGMLKGKMSLSRIKDYTPTLFIKLNKNTREVEAAWEGETYDFKEEVNRIKFKVKIFRKLEKLPQKYASYNEGWYLEYFEELPSLVPDELIIYPPFIYILERSGDWGEFESYTYLLLKLLGIHEIHKFGKQKGLPDGFFKFRNLVVMYDSTLEKGFEESKRTQVRNYINQLKQNEIRLGNKTVSIIGCKKQVWIITRGTTRVLGRVDDIVVKEVSITDLIHTYKDRILKESVDEVWLEKRLEEI